MSALRTIILSGRLQARQALAHGGKNSGTVHTFRTETIYDEHGKPIYNTPSISGGTIRYSLRSVATKMMHDFLVGDGKLPFHVVHAMHNGGSMKETKSVQEVITGEKQAKLRETVPLLGIFGGMGGARAISGRLDVDSAIPVTKETAYLAEHYQGTLIEDPEGLPSIHAILERYKYGRFSTSEGSDVQSMIDLDSDRELPKGGGMLFWSQEVLPLGVHLWHSVCLNDATPVEVSFFDEMMSIWSKNAHIGQQRRIGMGKVEPKYQETVTNMAGVTAERVECDWREELKDRKDEALEILNLL